MKKKKYVPCGDIVHYMPTKEEKERAWKELNTYSIGVWERRNALVLESIRKAIEEYLATQKVKLH